MANLASLKGVRTKYRNIIDKELHNAKEITCSDLSHYDVEDLLKDARKCAKLMKSYSVKLEDHLRRLTDAVGDSDTELIQKVVDEDCQLVLEVENQLIEIDQFLEASMLKSESEKISHKEKASETENLIKAQEKMQQLMLSQLKKQQEFLERQEQKESVEGSAVKLPKLDISSFNGNKLKWTEFWDTFECTVHRNSKLSDVEKFSYLLNKLIGEAKRAVDGLALSNENYEVAIDILRERFGNKQEIVDLHYKELMNAPSPTNKIQSLRSFLDVTEKHLRSLEVLEENINQHVFVSMIRSKLPEYVLRQLEFSKESSTDWTIDTLRDHLSKYVSACEKSEKTIDDQKDDKKYSAERGFTKSAQVSKQKMNLSSNRIFTPRRPVSAESLFVGFKEKSLPPKTYVKRCRYCEKEHWSDECSKYNTIEDRKRRIKGCCYRCLKEGHIASECRANKACVYCGEYNVHHRSLCSKKFKLKTSTRESSNVSLSDGMHTETTEVSTHQENVMVSTGEMVLMQTAKTEVKNKENSKSTDVRLLLDCGSQRTYITEGLANKLGLRKEKGEDIKLVTFGSKETKVIKTYSTTVTLRLNNGQYMDVSASIVPVISGNIQRKRFDIGSMENLEHILNSVDLADTIPTENEYSSIELLIGNDFYLDIILPQKIEVQPGLYLLSSKLGWLLTGRTSLSMDDESTDTNMLILTYGRSTSKTAVFQNVDSCIPPRPDLEDFWKTESIGVIDKQGTTEDERVMENFKEQLKFHDKRYYVTWPWKDEPLDLPENKQLAYGRLKSCIKRLGSKPELLDKYNNVIQDQLKKGVIEPVDESMKDGKVHYIPHHAVVTPQKTTTKLRVVYDASSKCRPEFKSLNECLDRGPVMLHDLCGLLMRFRLHKVAITADIEKAFLQVGLQPSERNVTRFLWLKSCVTPSTDQSNIQEFRFCRVPFGVISSPFLLGATVETHLETYNTKLAEKLKHDIYVDNLISGTATEAEAIELYCAAKGMFDDASFNLREWLSNSDKVNEFIPVKNRAEMIETNILGHVWNSQLDTLAIKRPKIKCDSDVVTKRSVLKVLASVFDPLGLFAPITLSGKLLLQQLWSRKVEWDDVIEDIDTKSKWNNISSDLSSISEFALKRCIAINDNSQVSYKLLCFCDASSSAYAAAVYLHQTSVKEKRCDLVFAKSRLAPVNGITIPRMELMAVLIGVRCLKFVGDQLKIKLDESYLWTDSQCVLGWLNSVKTLPVFVKNRVKEIKLHDKVRISYVSTKENPADIATRSTNVKSLIQNSTWWHGPLWLKDDIGAWFPTTEISSQVDCTADTDDYCDHGLFNLSDNRKELRRANTICAPFNIDCTKYSLITKLLRVTAFAMRFVKKISKRPCENSTLTAEEIQEAENLWIIHIQRKNFSDVIDGLKKQKQTNLQRQLGLYVDDKGILRCRGRLENASLSEGARSPVLLPRNEYFTQLIVLRSHKQSLHSGVSQTLSNVRYKYWIPQGRATIKSVLRTCNICRRHEGGPYKMPPLAPLPSARVRESQPFSRTGLDYFGPLYIKTENNAKTWVCLFTCMVTRAIHLELLQDMTAYEFLLGFKRFISQRGTPVEILSDNALQFKAASETLKSVWDNICKCDDIQSYVSNSGIKWTYIVELAPWMGGFYERLVGVVKRALRKSIGRKILTLVQLQTVLKEVEAIVNSRPLVYTDDDINSNITLTPAHFLTLNPSTGIPEVECDDVDSNYSPYESSRESLLKIWKKGQKLSNEFWKIWREEYLTNLRERMQSLLKTGRIQSIFTPEIDDVVLIKDNVARSMWRMGRVVELITSRDGQIRSAKVCLPSGHVLGRPLSLLYPIECSGYSAKNLIKEKKMLAPQESFTDRDKPPVRKAAEVAKERIKECMRD